MRLAEFGSQKITEAGKANIRYSKEESEPRREKSTIVLPDDPMAEMLNLEGNWHQFLYTDRRISSVWFGGTDENPFLVRMDESVFATALREGSQRFYANLVPSLITTMLRLLPYCQSGLRRQGDIFCLSVSYSEFSIRHATKLIIGKDAEMRKADDLPLFGTRHIIKGEGFQNVTLLGEEVPLLVRGKIEAPDHSPLEFKRLSVLAQTRNLYDPKQAD